MIRSMTGFGCGKAQGHGKAVTVELKSVNHRYGEVAVRLPRAYGALEERVRREVLKKVARGRVEAGIKVESLGDNRRQVKVDNPMAMAYYNSLRELAKTLEMPFELNLAQLAALPEVIALEETEEDLELIWAVIQEALDMALTGMITMREEEGRLLAKDLLQRLQYLADMNEEIEKRSPQVVEEYRIRLQNRIQELLGEIPVDPARVAMEVAIFADRCSIAEETVRLASHRKQFAKILEAKESVGRKLDFLVQEMNREINTIGSKANDLEISSLVVEVKSELEKIREQVQNIE